MAIALVQQNKNTANGATSVAVTLTGVTAGNVLIVTLGTYLNPANGLSSSVSGGGATWTRRGSRVSGRLATEIWEGLGGTGGSITVTASASTRDWAAVLTEWSGVDATPFDVTASGNGTSTSPSSGSTATTAQADELLIGAVSHQGSTISCVPGGSFTQLNDVLTGASTAVCGAAYRIVSATGAYSSDWTLGSSQIWTCAIATFKAAASGGSVTAAIPFPKGQARGLGLGIGMRYA